LDTYAREARYIYTSTLRRSVETARAICGDRAFEQMDMLVEAPLPPPHLPSFIRFSPNSSGWGCIARAWWWFSNTNEGGETRKQARARARQAALFLVSKAREGGDVLVLAHGYFNLLISLELKKMGFIKTVEQGFKYWGCRRYALRNRLGAKPRP
ncbi:MAG: histidine phosphatase family protein, partial [Asticcacaulis sp.]